MSDINWKENAVCYAYNKQWFHRNGDADGVSEADLVSESGSAVAGTCNVLTRSDFKLNEIVTGDFIPASELDTEQKYNEVVEVFGLFGFKRFDNASYADTIKAKTDSSCLKVNPSGELICNWHKGDRQLTYHQIIEIGKLKRMMLDRENSAPEKTTDFTKVSSNKYEREITDRQGNIATVDVYDVIIAYGVTCPATQHAIKKLLCTGDRGHKDTLTDLSEARDAITRAIELN